MMDQVGKLVGQSVAYNTLETLTVVGVIAFTVFVIKLATEKIEG